MTAGLQQVARKLLDGTAMVLHVCWTTWKSSNTSGLCLSHLTLELCHLVAKLVKESGILIWASKILIRYFKNPQKPLFITKENSTIVNMKKTNNQFLQFLHMTQLNKLGVFTSYSAVACMCNDGTVINNFILNRHLSQIKAFNIKWDPAVRNQER